MGASFALHTYLNRVWISAVVRNPLPLRSRHLNKYVKPSGVSLFSRAKTKSRKLSKSISRPFTPPTLLRRTCSSKTEIHSHIVVMYNVYMNKLLKADHDQWLNIYKFWDSDNKWFVRTVADFNLFQWKSQSTCHLRILWALVCPGYHFGPYPVQETYLHKHKVDIKHGCPLFHCI